MATVKILKRPFELARCRPYRVTATDPRVEAVLWVMIDGFDYARPARFRKQGWRLIRGMLAAAETMDKRSPCEAVRLLRRQLIQQAWQLRVNWRTARPAGMHRLSGGQYVEAHR